MVSSYIDHLLISVSMITGYVSISSFASFVGIPISIVSSAKGLKICLIAGGMSIIKKKKEKSLIKQYC